MPPVASVILAKFGSMQECAGRPCLACVGDSLGEEALEETQLPDDIQSPSDFEEKATIWSRISRPSLPLSL